MDYISWMQTLFLLSNTSSQIHFIYLCAQEPHSIENFYFSTRMFLSMVITFDTINCTY